ncbi:phospholipase A2 inhibitor and Ly6/PLAUR domain-containing protein-like [Podarcis raffonei]|uniref:phospholipase A2 inhibitor and Ly6/PLAUR domain-containing protein-like n=1 Tax=Podarcis raffonei TaxID=65483 RepID=UPI0023293C71|nr:phospholipase A2 inhibitor and Ly6/PLAUR domain-containing protein-like [Podarcis raffonei]
MMKTLLISCLLLTLLNPVATLTCESCFGQEKDCKNATTVECDDSPDQSCMSAFGVGKLSLLGSTMVLKSCINTELCDADYASASITSSMYIQIKGSCCKTDMCNSGPPEMPANETRELNGLKCPSCLTILTDDCEGNKTVSCRNEEDQCFYAGGLVKLGGSSLIGALRGCATASMCNYSQEMLGTYLKSLGYEITQLECTDAMDDANQL